MRIGENVTHRADGRWEARYIKGRNPDGSAIYGFCYGRTREEALQKRNDAELITKNSAIDEPKTFGDVFGMISGANDDETARLAEKFILPQIGSTPITAMSDSSLASVMQEIKRKSSATDVKRSVELLKTVFDYAVNEDYLLESPVKELTLKYKNGRKSIVTKGFLPITEDEYLSIPQAELLEKVLLEGLDGKRPGVSIGLFLCLHLGLNRMEVGALQLKDIDFRGRTISINKITTKQLKANDGIYAYEMTPVEERLLPLPQFLYDFLLQIKDRYSSSENFIVYNKNGAQCQGSEYLRELKQIGEEHPDLPKLDFKMFRDTFIVRCICNGLDIFTVAALSGIQNIADIQSRYGAFFKAKPYALCKFGSYASGADRSRTAKRMNLLIFGAGGEGHVAKEIAENMGIFNEIAFLDDDPNNTEAINSFSSYEQYLDRFPVAIVALGANHLRAKLTDEIERAGFIMPVLIDPSATLSRNAVLSAPCIIESKSIINTGCRIGRGAIIASGSILDRDCELREFVHIDAGVTVAKGTVVDSFTGISNNPNYINNK